MIATIRDRHPTLAAALPLLVLLTFSLAGPVAAQERRQLEYEPHEGVGEQEWYDIDDWFDADRSRGGIQREFELFDYPYADYPEEYYSRMWPQWYRPHMRLAEPPQEWTVTGRPNGEERRERREGARTPRINWRVTEEATEDFLDWFDESALPRNVGYRGPVRIEADLLDLASFPIEGSRERHVLAKVALDSRRTAIVSLGPDRGQYPRRLPDRTLWIHAVGVPGSINRLPVIVAQRVAIDGLGTFPAWSLQLPVPPESRFGRRLLEGRAPEQDDQQDQQEDQQQQDRPIPPRRVEATGRIIDMDDVSLAGVPEQHRLIRIAIEGGGIVFVDLGDSVRAERLGLRPGDVIRLRGTTARISNRPVISARWIAGIGEINAPQADQQPRQQRRQPQQTDRPAQRQQRP